MNQFTAIKKIAEKDIENYRFGQALHKIYNFFWHDFCDIYIEKSKVQIADHKSQKSTQTILFYVLFESLKLLHPFMPFVSEEIYQNLAMEQVKNKKMLITEKW